MENFEDNCKETCEELYVHLGKFVNKNNHSAGTKARKSAQTLKKLLQSLREDILKTQHERKAVKESGKEDKVEAPKEEVVEEVVEAPKEEKKVKGKKKKAKGKSA